MDQYEHVECTMKEFLRQVLGENMTITPLSMPRKKWKDDIWDENTRGYGNWQSTEVEKSDEWRMCIKRRQRLIKFRRDRHLKVLEQKTH